MKKLRLLCIPPYEGMYHLMTNIAAQRSDVELIVHMGNLDDGLKTVLDNRDNNIDAIISRGGTAETIRRHSDIPVCDIIPSVYDILRTIRLAQGMSERFAVVGFSSLTTPADMLRDIMQYDFTVHTIHSAAECEQRLQELRERGIRIIVGDTISVNCAQKYNMSGLLIVSGVESVETAIESAIQMNRYYGSVSKNASLLADLLNTDEEDTLIFSSDEQLVFSSMTELPQELLSLLRSKVSYVIAQDSLKIVRRQEKQMLSINARRLASAGEDYCVYRISRLSDAANYDKYMIQHLSADEDMPDCSPLEYYLGSSKQAQELRLLCDRYAAMQSPVLLLGERGSGKDRFAHYIYSHSRQRHSSFVVIDASLLGDKGWDFLLKSDNSPLTDSGLSIYFRRLNAATAEQRRGFLNYLKSSRVYQSNRLLFSYTDTVEFDPLDEFYLYLTETIHCLPLVTIPLSRRREDISTLVGLYINAVNVQSGTRVIGLTHDAMLTLQNHNWTRNVDELLQTVRTLVISARSSYISNEQVCALLSRDRQQKAEISMTDLDLHRSLDEITRDIVLRVYEDEHMNQTHTAKRLGISRSTLWRMLK